MSFIKLTSFIHCVRDHHFIKFVMMMDKRKCTWIIFLLYFGVASGQICRKINDRLTYCSGDTMTIISDSEEILSEEARNGWDIYAKDLTINKVLDKGKLKPVKPWVKTLRFMESCFREINTNYFETIFKGNLQNLEITDMGCLTKWTDDNGNGLNNIQKFSILRASKLVKLSDFLLMNNNALKELEIKNTELTTLPSNIFSSVTEKVNLENNKLVSLPHSWTDVFKTIRTYDLTGNRWNCNCDLVIKVYSMRDVPGFLTFTCYDPPKFRNQQLNLEVLKQVCPEYYYSLYPTKKPAVPTTTPKPVIRTQPPKKEEDKDKYKWDKNKPSGPEIKGDKKTTIKSEGKKPQTEGNVKSAGVQSPLKIVGIAIGVVIGVLLIVIIIVLVKFRHTLFGSRDDNTASQGNGNTKYRQVNQKPTSTNNNETGHLVYKT